MTPAKVEMAVLARYRAGWRGIGERYAGAAEASQRRLAAPARSQQGATTPAPAACACVTSAQVEASTRPPRWAALKMARPILAGGPLEAPDGPKAPIARVPTPEGRARLTGRLKGLAGRSGSTNGGDVNLR